MNLHYLTFTSCIDDNYIFNILKIEKSRKSNQNKTDKEIINEIIGSFVKFRHQQVLPILKNTAKISIWVFISSYISSCINLILATIIFIIQIIFSILKLQNFFLYINNISINNTCIVY